MEVPPLKAVQAALRKTTEQIAAELAYPTRSQPAWSDFEWRAARAVAAMHGVSPLLATTLRWQGPQEWQSFLAQQQAHTQQRHRRIEELLQLFDCRAKAAGIAAMALKGAALHSVGIYRPGERPMADVDILVTEQNVEPASRMLEELGFREAHSVWRHRSFAPAETRTSSNLGEHADNCIKIELHERISEALPLRKVDITDLVFATRPSPGLNPYPSTAALMIHLLLHAAGSMVSRSLRLLQLQDIALLAKRMTDADWAEIVRPRASGEFLWWAFPPLLLASRYYIESIPLSILNALASNCPILLRRITRRRSLSEVSLSFLWIEAFPGIEWARTAGEMAEYIGKRIKPDTEMMSVRKSLAATETRLAENPWTHLHQGTRILRWIASRPPRPATMCAVRAVFDTSI